MSNSENKKTTLILGVIGADCHSVGNRVLQDFFTEKGFNVINLGVMVSRDEFVDAAAKYSADAILVSSLYGHGEIDCEGLRKACIDRGMDNIILYIGGNLVVGKKPFDEVAVKFKNMGFDRVFPSDADLDTVVRDLLMDIGNARKKSNNAECNALRCSG